MNHITLIGRITKDIELKKSNSGKDYAKFTLAVTRPLNKNETDFINCVVFGKTAEVMNKYVSKGHRIGLTGRLQTNKYEHNGEKRISFDVMVDNIEFLENKNNSSNNDSGSTIREVAQIGNDYSENDEFPF